MKQALGNMNRSRRGSLPGLLALVVFMAPLAIAQPGLADHEVAVEKDVRVKVIKCREGDCSEMVKNVAAGGDVEVVVTGDENRRVVVHRIHCDGEECDQNGAGNAIFVGGPGEHRVVLGDGHHSWISGDGLLGGGYLGVGLTELTAELREHFGAPTDAGVMVSEVVDESPAFKAGIKVGDIISQVDGEPVSSSGSLARVIRQHEQGDVVVLGVWRHGAATTISAALGERESSIRIPHFEHLGDGKHLRTIMIQCDSDDEECASNVDVAGLEDFDCGGDDCKIRIECGGDGCTCSVNGEDADCAGIPGAPSR